MASITVKNVPDEAEIRHILENVVKPNQRVKLGSLLASICREVGGLALDLSRDQNAVLPLDFK